MTRWRRARWAVGAAASLTLGGCIFPPGLNRGAPPTLPPEQNDFAEPEPGGEFEARVDVGRKDLALAHGTGDEPFYAAPGTETPTPRLSAFGGAMFFDRGMDLDTAPCVGLRWMVPLRGGDWELDLPVKVGFAGGDLADAAGTQHRITTPSGVADQQPPPSTEDGTTSSRDGAVINAEIVVSRVLRTWTQTDWRLGVGAGATAFTGFGGGHDDFAPSLSASLAWDFWTRGRLSAWVDAQVHGVYTDFGREDRTWRPMGVLALGLSWDL